jgi:hypothetical protein
MAYSSITKPTLYFDTVTWDTVDTSIDTLSFAPDFAWIKIRDNADSHCGFDTVRGVQKRITLGQSSAESTQSAELTAFNSDGYTLGTGDNVNRASKKACSWNWKGGGTAASNSDGTITSSISANTTSGFSIVTYSGNGTAGATVGHGLGVTPGMIWVKRRGTSDGWIVYHNKSLSSNPATVHSRLDTTAVTSDDNTKFNDTEPTSSVFSIGSDTAVNSSSDTYVAYCFAEKKAFCKIGSYEGNGSTDGTFIYTGFKPALIIIKNIDATKHWMLYDNKRADEFNPQNERMIISGAFTSYESDSRAIDFLSNGFKMKDNGTDSSSVNASGNTHIYYAVAESPLVANVSGGLPTTAR